MRDSLQDILFFIMTMGILGPWLVGVVTMVKYCYLKLGWGIP